MRRIFISHSSSDTAAASQLAADLRNAGHEAAVDEIDLGLGDDSIDFMNRGIAEAHAIIILFSQHTINAKWQHLEINAALWNEVAQAGGVCIVLRLDETPIPPLLGPKVYGYLDTSDRVAYKKAIEDICRVVLPSRTATSIVNEALSPKSRNPFRRIRAEYFEERPDLLSAAFAAPDASKTGVLEELRPCFLEGSRGTGKTMLLLSLRARVHIPRHQDAQRQYSIFGFYLKFTRGALCNVGRRPDKRANEDPILVNAFRAEQVSDITAQEFVVCLLESLLSELQHCITERLIDCDAAQEQLLTSELYEYLFLSRREIRSIQELLSDLANTHRRIADFIRRKFIYRENPAVPIATLDFEAFKHVVARIKSRIPNLRNAMFVALLDEYENLFPYQQKIVNTFVKLAAPSFSVKVAKKLSTSEVSGTTIAQELQEIHDYARLSLVYDVEDPAAFKIYRELLEHIVRNLFTAEGLSFQTMAGLLPTYLDSEVPQDDLTRAVAELCKVSAKTFAEWSDEERREKIAYYGDAAIYRSIYGAKGRQPEKRFASFKDLAFLSSGVIRYFQEMLGVAYHLTFGDAPPPRDSTTLPPEKQTRAVHLVSTHNLTTLSRNVEEDGEVLKYFLLDLGDCLRHKLLKHTSEPEAARLTIKDPEVLDQERFGDLKRLLSVGTREGVFQTKEGRPAFKPRHSSDPQPSEFNISRIYAPVLQISPRLRWRTPVTCEALRRLLDPNERAKAKKSLMNSLKGSVSGDGPSLQLHDEVQ